MGTPAIDGKFGPNTENAVKKFQQDNQLKVDGIAGPETWGAICKLLLSASPTNTVKEIRGFYHQIALEQETVSKTLQNTTSGTLLFQKYSAPAEEEEMEMENDLPFYSGIVNLTKGEIVAIQAEPSPGENVTQPLTDVNTTAASGEQIRQSLSLCSDRNPPDSSTGLCADGSQPQSQSFNATVTPAPDVTTAEQQLVCSNGTAPDVTTGLCADGSQPQSQSFNATVTPAPDVTTAEQQLVCSDGTAPDVTTGLCADGSQPQSQSFNATVTPLLMLLLLNSN